MLLKCTQNQDYDEHNKASQITSEIAERFRAITINPPCTQGSILDPSVIPYYLTPNHDVLSITLLPFVSELKFETDRGKPSVIGRQAHAPRVHTKPRLR